jgi:hypothetical protein
MISSKTVGSGREDRPTVTPALPVAYRLYLPEEWAKDQDLQRKAKMPEEIVFQTKPEIALDQIKAARAAGLPEGRLIFDEVLRFNTPNEYHPYSPV